MVKLFKENFFFGIGSIAVFVLFFANVQNAFFWDTIQLGSQHATYYLNNHFISLALPDDIDSGHIPFFGFYLALVWKVFGRTLFVSHLAMLPFILGIFWQLNQLIKHFFESKYFGLTFCLLLLDPTLLAQMTLISPDVLLVFFFLLAFNSILKNHKIIVAISVLSLFLTSMRGMMISLLLLIIDIVCNIGFKRSFKELLWDLLKRGIIYLPALLVFLVFSWWHYKTKGWIGYHPDSPWADCFAPVGFSGFLKNSAVLAWRILDFGRIGAWFVLLVLMFRYWKQIWRDRSARFLLFVVFCFLLILPANMLWAKNLMAHRYLLPVYLTVSLFVAKVLFSRYVNEKLKYVLTSIWLLFLISGNFWIYPDKISMGWDSTLAHLPYYELRQQAIEFLEEQQIDFNNVQTFFPNTASLNLIDLNGDSRTLSGNSESEYVLYSNVYNLSDDLQEKFAKEYTLLREFKYNRIYMRVCKKRELETEF